MHDQNIQKLFWKKNSLLLYGKNNTRVLVWIEEPEKNIESNIERFYILTAIFPLSLTSLPRNKILFWR